MCVYSSTLEVNTDDVEECEKAGEHTLKCTQTHTEAFACPALSVLG